MNKRTIAVAMATCMLLSITACDRLQAKASEIHTQATFGATDETGATTPIFMQETYEEVVLASETGATYDFSYDTDILTYTGQGGNFYLVGSDATKCFLHVVVLDQAQDSFDSSKTNYKSSITSEFTLGSGHNAFIYKTADANNIHVVIDGSSIFPSGKGVINVYIGSASSWPYSAEQIAGIVDSGFKV